MELFPSPLLNLKVSRFSIIALALFILFPAFTFCQTFVGASGSPLDNSTPVSQTGTTATITPPAGMQAGDLVIVYAHYRSTTGTVTMASNTGQAWTLETNGSGGNQTFYIFSCRYNGIWTNNPEVTGGSASIPLSAVMYVFRPSNADRGWIRHQGPTNTNSSTNPFTVASVTTTAARTVTMAFWASGAANSWGSLTNGGSGWSKASFPSAQFRNSAGSGQSHSAAYNIRTSAGATNSVAQTQSSAVSTRMTSISWAEVVRPANDDFAAASTITSDSACVNGTSRLTGQTLLNASIEGNGVSPACGATGAQDVWYKFVAKTKHPTISVTGIGSDLAGVFRMQVLTGTYASLNEITCTSGTSFTPALTAPLTPGTTYYIRIHKSNATAPTTGNWGFTICVTDNFTRGGRMREIFSRTVLVGASVMNNPWEVTYGPDDKLWVTDSKNYRVYRIDPNTGASVTVLDISQNSTTAPDNSFRCQFNNGAGAQGGLAGLALHPNFLDGTDDENNSVYISYIYSGSGSFFTNRLVKFTYNPGTNRLVSPVSICDTLPGSNDHNSQRMIIAPEVEGGPKYLFYASGDMGAGQGNATNRARTIKSQFPNSYEGKILRFNLEEDNDAVQTPATINYNRWIPNDNPYNTMLGKQSAVWNIGQRNNQGFVYDTATHILYGSSHGAYSDDEINILERGKNYGHPLVIGFAADGNYNGTTTPSTSTSISAGAPFPVGSGNSTCPPIGNEATNATTINGNGNGAYKDPLFSGYPGATGTGAGSVANIWATNPNNSTWPSEGWSGLDLYNDKIIPGWKRSLIASGLKWGRLIRLKLGPNGTTTLPSNLAYQNTNDTVLYFQSSNRYRDIAFGPNGKDIYVIMDNNAASAATDGNPPVTPACAGCLVKYSFLGYADNGGKSTIPTSIDVTAGVSNTVNQGTTITIDGTNNHLWVPITGPDGNIMAEINAMGQNLGVVTSCFYTNTAAVRSKKGFYYLDRNITITPANNSFSTPVKIRLYLTKAEFQRLDDHASSGITGGIAQLKMMKNDDPCGAAILSSTEEVIAVNTTELERTHGTGGYMLQGEVSEFSSFYFGAANMSTLPVDLITFKGSLQNNATLLQWETANERNTSHFEIERSIDGRSYDVLGTTNANNAGSSNTYMFADNNVTTLPATVIYYRLKIVEADGQHAYSNIVTIRLADLANKVVLAPNPAKHETKVMITSILNGKARWKLMDNHGRVVAQESIQLTRGANSFTINLNGLGGGVYYLNISGEGINQNIKLQKL